jgi:calcineurin-like phosphoesterase
VAVTTGNVFGGFTPLEWESREWNGTLGNADNCLKADDSLRSFVFTLKNPHNIPARRFALKAEQKWRAITYYYDSRWGPCIGGHTGVPTNCNASTASVTSLGTASTNDIGLPGTKVFTGSSSFQVQEIEVFKITE